MSPLYQSSSSSSSSSSSEEEFQPRRFRKCSIINRTSAGVKRKLVSTDAVNRKGANNKTIAYADDEESYESPILIPPALPYTISAHQNNGDDDDDDDDDDSNDENKQAQKPIPSNLPTPLPPLKSKLITPRHHKTKSSSSSSSSSSAYKSPLRSTINPNSELFKSLSMSRDRKNRSNSNFGVGSGLRLDRSGSLQSVQSLPMPVKNLRFCDDFNVEYSDEVNGTDDGGDDGNGAGSPSSVYKYNNNNNRNNLDSDDEDVDDPTDDDSADDGNKSTMAFPPIGYYKQYLHSNPPKRYRRRWASVDVTKEHPKKKEISKRLYRNADDDDSDGDGDDDENYNQAMNDNNPSNNDANDDSKKSETSSSEEDDSPFEYERPLMILNSSSTRRRRVNDVTTSVKASSSSSSAVNVTTQTTPVKSPPPSSSSSSSSSSSKSTNSKTYAQTTPQPQAKQSKEVAADTETPLPPLKQATTTPQNPYLSPKKLTSTSMNVLSETFIASRIPRKMKHLTMTNEQLTRAGKNRIQAAVLRSDRGNAVSRGGGGGEEKKSDDTVEEDEEGEEEEVEKGEDGFVKASTIQRKDDYKESRNDDMKNYNYGSSS